MDDNSKTIAANRRTVTTLQGLRNEFTLLCKTCPQRSIRHLAEPMYLELTDLLLRHSAVLDDDRLIQTALLAARTAMDQLKIAKLRNCEIARLLSG